MGDYDVVVQMGDFFEVIYGYWFFQFGYDLGVVVDDFVGFDDVFRMLYEGQGYLIYVQIQCVVEVFQVFWGQWVDWQDGVWYVYVFVVGDGVWYYYGGFGEVMVVGIDVYVYFVVVDEQVGVWFDGCKDFWVFQYDVGLVVWDVLYVEVEFVVFFEVNFVIGEGVYVQFWILQVEQYVDGVVDFFFDFMDGVEMFGVVGMGVVVEVQMEDVGIGQEQFFDFFFVGIGGVQGCDDFCIMLMVIYLLFF